MRGLATMIELELCIQLISEIGMMAVGSADAVEAQLMDCERKRKQLVKLLKDAEVVEESHAVEHEVVAECIAVRMEA